MSPVSLKEARKRLGDLVRAAELGASVPITRRGKTVARLVPPDTKPSRTKAPDLGAFRASLRAKGKSLSRIVIDSRRAERW